LPHIKIFVYNLNKIYPYYSRFAFAREKEMREIIKFRGKIKGFSKFQDDLHDDPELYDIRELKKAKSLRK